MRRVAWEALAARSARATTLEQARELHEILRPFWLQRAAFDSEPSLAVRAAFLEVELPLLSKLRSLDGGWNEAQSQEMLLQLDGVAQREPPLVLAGLARALARIPERFASDMLTKLAHHPDLLVAEASIEALAQHPSDGVHELLLSLLAHEDNGIRLAAVLALDGMARADDLPALVELYSSTRGEIGAEVRFNTVRVAQRIQPQEPSPVTTAALADPDAFVRRVAREAYAALGRTPPQVELAAASASSPPLPGIDYPLYAHNPQVEIVTVRGTMVFELLPAEAPTHAASFLELAARGIYDGLTFHRVVPDFVVQGGDPRGDGNGGASWRGDALRAGDRPAQVRARLARHAAQRGPRLGRRPGLRHPPPHAPPRRALHDLRRAAWRAARCWTASTSATASCPSAGSRRPGASRPCAAGPWTGRGEPGDWRGTPRRSDGGWTRGGLWRVAAHSPQAVDPKGLADDSPLGRCAELPTPRRAGHGPIAGDSCAPTAGRARESRA